MIRSLLRQPLRLIPATAVLPVLSGPNAGRRWIKGSGNPSYWLGYYERRHVQHFLDQARPGSVVWDIGANVGYYALAAARKTDAKVVAIEALPENAAFLRRHVALNRADAIEVIEAAVTATHNGTVLFERADSRFQGKVGAGDLVVRSVSIDGLIADGRPVPALVKMDIEGGEADALTGAGKLLAARRTVWVVSLHGAAVARRCYEIFTRHGYVLTDGNDDRTISGISDIEDCWGVWARP
jgi:FkbM family methyltransferase